MEATDAISNDSVLEMLVHSVNSFDHEAAENATRDEAAQRLKVLKHYVRVIFESTDANRDLKDFLTFCGLEAEVPGSVVGGFRFVLGLLKLAHPNCTGRDCVAKHRRKVASGLSTPPGPVFPVTAKFRTCVKMPNVMLEKKEEKKRKKSSEIPSYFI